MSKLKGWKVALVEDEPLILLLLADYLESEGAQVKHQASDLAGAMQIAAIDGVDVAVLDIDLRGQESFPAAIEFRRNGVPVIFASGNEPESVPAEIADAKFLRKPVVEETLVAAITEVTCRERTD